ncbi:uncharacterized protein EV420DRAFT_1099775 [Desarmillaria tabescens]|uniref:SH3 domain-containing protein n=1 Tax=Armillaria tabescens TaxID=1929756 RepID=A0AA39NDJ2_ARMTA|nr:uncharacterized protein EV420DRAFT_1099775 [Desarmillaria tabescens]KAK0463626.1 hypothetical protein EV420DRAFT_1099775 [Desarmillaria tabescens]
MPSSPQHLPAERVRHRKRASVPVEQRDDEQEEYSTSTGPITTITITKGLSSTASSDASLSTTATTTRSSASSLSSTSATTSSSSSLVSSSTAESTSAGSSSLAMSTTSTPPLPSASAIAPAPTSASDVQQNGAVSKQTLPAGAIAGIVIAVVLVLVAVALVLLRNRFMQRRRSRMSTWISKPRLANTGLAFESVTSTTHDASQSPGMQFAQSGAPATSLTMPSASWNNAASPGINPSTAPPSGGSAIVKSRFIPSLPDELPISNGETVRIMQEFDDGWALCVNGREEQGMVPLECLERLTPTSGAPATAPDLRKSARESSLYGMNTVRR